MERSDSRGGCETDSMNQEAGGEKTWGVCRVWVREERKTGASWTDLKTEATQDAALHRPVTPTSPLSPAWAFSFCSPPFSHQRWNRPNRPGPSSCSSTSTRPWVHPSVFLFDPALWSGCFTRWFTEAADSLFYITGWVTVYEQRALNGQTFPLKQHASSYVTQTRLDVNHLSGRWLEIRR